ncbi:MAG: phosphotransferase family protein [Acidimicrobiales bacterium]|jgi:aminoglycoside phosphotransferase (APT) family kinase protein|nr:phosphotransferase family protein [Acidimicrobiales bacterium]
MPVEGQRDPAHVTEVLERWMAGQMPHVGPVEVTDLVVPQASGFSNETFLFDASWTGADGRRETAALVLRSQPLVHKLFPESDLLVHQYEVIRHLGEHTDVPVPRTRGAESDPAVLGAPFFVMDRLAGQVPGDSPPYTQEGFVMEMSPARREEWHRNAVAALVQVGQVDWRAAGLAFLDQPHHGPTGAVQRRNYSASYLAWATKGEAHPVVHPAWDWLEANWPDDTEHLGLAWGDARPGNLMFDGTEVIGVFDWEMVALGNPESDLGWWLFLQRYSTDGVGAPLPPGMLDRAATIALWEDLMGRPASHVDFYEKLAGFHFCLVMVKLAEMFAMSMGPDALAMAVHNPVTQITCELMDLEMPAPTA